MGILYKWTRFWAPHDGRFYLDFNGYLEDPEGGDGKLRNPDVVPLGCLTGSPCLVLLGEPGAGKTSALRAEREAEERRIAASGGALLWVDLHEVASPAELSAKVFESPAWKNPSGTLHLFLDSVEESPMGAEVIAAQLLGSLDTRPKDQLRVRLVCRTAEWPRVLENGLKERWADTKIYEIAPLRRMDVESAARSHGLDPSSALEVIAEREAVPLALRPVTLAFLLTRLAAGKPLPGSKVELYKDQCRSLCAESNENRPRWTASPDECVALAQRIASSLLFAGKTSVFVDPDPGDLPEGDLPLGALAGDREPVEGELFVDAREPALRATLSTGLFTSRGRGRLAFAHHTFAEFLAARYVWCRKLPLAQVRALMVHPGLDRVVPHLHGVAAWLASMDENFFEVVLERDPQVLLAADAATFDTGRKRRIVEVLLARHDRREQLDGDPFLRQPFEKLAHEGLDDVLRRYITGNRHDPGARCVAIEIAGACKATSLCGALIAVVEDPNDHLEVRSRAAYALETLGDAEIRARLMPLALGTDPTDLKDDLKGSALRALWPKHISISEVLAALTPTRAPNRFGLYKTFFLFDVVAHASDDDFLALLAWTNEQPSRQFLEEPSRELITTVLEKAWERLDRPAFLEAYARAVLTRMQHRDIPLLRRDMPERQWALDCEKRRRLLRSLLEMVDNTEDGRFRFRELLGDGDAEWLTALLDEEISTTARSFLVALLPWALRFEAPFELIDSLARACARHADLADGLRPLFEAMPVDGPGATEARSRGRAMNAERRRRSSTLPPASEHVGAILDRFESGETAAYWEADLQLGMAEDGREDWVDDPSDATKLPGWITLDDAVRRRVVAAAARYLVTGKCSPEAWAGEGPQWSQALAGYRALRLVMKEDRAAFDTLAPSTWKEWAPIVGAFPGIGEKEARDHGLLVHAYRHAPDVVIETVIAGLIDDDAHGRHLLGLRRLAVVWDERVSKELLELVVRRPLRPASLREVLGMLLGHGTQGAVAAATSFICLPAPRDDVQRSRMSVACACLMQKALAAAWTSLYPVLIAERAFAREVVGDFALHAEMRSGTIMGSLSEEGCGRFLAWLEDELPHFQDRAGLQSREVGVCKRVTEMRTAIVRELAAKGTIPALEVLRAAEAAKPGRPYLRWGVLEAEHHALCRTWSPVSPAELRSLARDASRRLVSDEDGLLEVVVDSLTRFGKRLHGPSGMVRFLWDKQLDGTFVPVDENAFSDLVRDHLETDIVMSGVVLNREVQLRPSVARKSGERTDIHIDAVSRDMARRSYGKLTLIVETKGAWNRDLFRDMETQLHDRYLSESPARRGVYLVGWFASALWTDIDERRRRVPREGMQSVASRLAQQATACSAGRIRIKAIILDATLPGEPQAVAGKARAARSRKVASAQRADGERPSRTAGGGAAPSHDRHHPTPTSAAGAGQPPAKRARKRGIPDPTST